MRPSKRSSSVTAMSQRETRVALKRQLYRVTARSPPLNSHPSEPVLYTTVCFSSLSGMDALSLPKVEEEKARHARRVKLKALNLSLDTPGLSRFYNETSVSHPTTEPSKLDSSLKRHTALIKRMRQSIGSDNRDQIIKDIDSLSLEKYIDEIAAAALDGIARCKTEKDVCAAVEVRDPKASSDWTHMRPGYMHPP